MKVNVRGAEVHIATGGRDHVEGQKTIMFLHGSGSSHLVWISQTRTFAYDGLNVVAADMPGHNLSKGDPLEGIEDQAKWALELLDTLKIKEVILVGHSQGGLTALEMSRQSPERVSAITFMATAAAIPVNDFLLDMASNKQDRAISSMTSWGHGPQAHMHDNTWPGASQVNIGIDVMEQNAEGALSSDLLACSKYENGLEIASSLECPTMCVLAEKDKMTPLKFGKKLAASLQNNEMNILAGAGHMLPTERPREINELLRGFLKKL